MIVEAESLGKSFRASAGWGAALRRGSPTSRQALSDVSFAVREGEIFGLLGPNGAGKTTLFKILATLLDADGGDARIGGFSVRDAAPDARRLLAPVLANERSLYWRLSARENLRVYAVLQGVPSHQVRSEIDRVLGAIGFSDVPDTMVGTFSTGMRQRLLIARALLGRPRVLLLDEPTRSLDPISARDFRRFLRESIVRAEGCTVLLATHDAEDVWELCDRVAVLDKGRLLVAEESQRLRARVGGAQQGLLVPSTELSRAEALLTAAGVAVGGIVPQQTSLATLIERVIADASTRPVAEHRDA